MWLQPTCTFCGRKENDRRRSPVPLPKPTTCVYVLTCVPAALSLSFPFDPAVSPSLRLSARTRVLSLSGGWGGLLMTPVRPSTHLSVLKKKEVCLFIYLFISWNAITGLTSESLRRSNYLLKDKCVSYTWVSPSLWRDTAATKTKIRDKTYGIYSQRSKWLNQWFVMFVSLAADLFVLMKCILEPQTVIQSHVFQSAHNLREMPEQNMLL